MNSGNACSHAIDELTSLSPGCFRIHTHESFGREKTVDNKQTNIIVLWSELLINALLSLK